MYFDRNIYKLGKYFFMRGKKSKYETELLVKLATGLMFTQMSAKEGIQKFGAKAVPDMIKEYRKIKKGPM